MSKPKPLPALAACKECREWPEVHLDTLGKLYIECPVCRAYSYGYKQQRKAAEAWNRAQEDRK